MAKWSEIYTEHKGHKYIIAALLEAARFTPPAKSSRKTKGQYPHEQPFFRNRREEEKVAA